jgi:hypothetical protein
MKKIFSIISVFSLLLFTNFAKAQYGQQPMFGQPQMFQNQRVPSFMDAQAAQMMAQGGMQPGFVGQVPGSYNDNQCLNASMLMQQAPLTPAYMNNQQQFINGHQPGY